MAAILWVEKEGHPSSLPATEALSPKDALTKLQEGATVSTAVIGLSIDAKTRVARQLATIDADLSILILATEEDQPRLQSELRFEPRLSKHTRVVVADETLQNKITAACEDTEARRGYRLQLTQAQKRLTKATPPQGFSLHNVAISLWASSPFGVLVVVPETFLVVSANPAACKLVEAEAMDLVGKPLGALFPHTHGDWSWLTEEDDYPERILSRRDKNSTPIYFQLRAVQAENTSSNFIQLYFWDITERVRLEELQAEYLESERRARQAAERASRVREEILATVSHDLRSPLQTLMMSAQLLSIGELESEELVNTGEMIERTTLFMKGLVDDLLDVARIEGSGLTLNLAEVSVANVLAQTRDVTRSRAEKQGVHLKTSTVEQDVTFQGDFNRLVQLLQNLVDNAIKFSPAGEEVRIEVDANEEQILFSVIDRGAGIAEEELPRLFEHFWQAERGDERGLGLGLAIVRGIVDAHQGRIHVESTLGAGTSVHIELPRKVD